MKNELMSPKDRLLVLEQSELKIDNNLRRTQDASCAIGRELYKIREEELYLARENCKSFADYVEARWCFDVRTATRVIGIAFAVDRLKKAGLELPGNESQVAELLRLTPEQQPGVWQQILDGQQLRDQPLTARGVRRMVDEEIERERAKTSAPAAARPGVKTDLDLDDTKDNGAEQPKEEPKKKVKVPDHIVLSEKGSVALERIRRLCNDMIADSILYLQVPISERDLRHWADQNDDVVVSIAHYVIDLRWSVAKAIGFEAQTIGPTTPFAKVIERVQARGGAIVFDYLDAKVEVTLRGE